MRERQSDPARRLLSCLGLCVRAGKVIFGVPQIVEAMRRGGANAPVTVFEAADTSENTHKRIADKCSYYKVRHVRLVFSSAELSDAVGKSSSVAAVAVSDENFYKLLEKHIQA